MKFPVSSASSRSRSKTRFRRLLLAIGLPLMSLSVHAQPPLFGGFYAGGNERERLERPAGLRESLTPRDEREESAAPRRKLSSEERSALRRDVRDAMRGAYPDDQRLPRRRN
ncbi:MAG: hypothetical protein JSR40_13125 [Proteobacteria bacterium]|nr:hypothetical protein [Pseudomonadota bacterium]